MNNSITVQEKFSKYWKPLTTVSGILAITCFALYFKSGNILAGGYLQLSSFIFFIIFLIGSVKLYEGKTRIECFANDMNLDVKFFRKDRKVAEGEIDLSKIEKVEISELPNKTIYNDIVRSDKCIRLKNKSGQWFYLNEISEQVVPLDIRNAKKMYDFLVHRLR